MTRLCIILSVILAARWAPADAQPEAREVAHVSGWRKKRLEALKAQVAAERAELSRLREELAHARRQRFYSRVSRPTSGDIGVNAPSATRGAPTNTSSAEGFRVNKALRSSHASHRVVQALASKAAREEEARVKDELRIQEAKLEDTNPTSARKLKVKALLSLPNTEQLAQAVAMKVSREEKALAKVKDVSASAKRKLQIQEAKDFLAAAQEDFKGHDEEAKQFLSAALKSLGGKDGDVKEVEKATDAANAHKTVATQKALEAKQARALLNLRKLRAEKAREKSRLRALKDSLRKAKSAILKVKEATTRVKQTSHELPAEPLEPQAVSVGLARMRNKAKSATLQMAKAHQLAAVVHKLEVDKAAEQRAMRQGKQSHKAVVSDLMELRKVEAKLLETQ